MFDLYDRVLHKPSGKPCFIIDIDEGIDPDTGLQGSIYGIEAENQDDNDWFYWAEENELIKIPEHR